MAIPAAVAKRYTGDLGNELTELRRGIHQNPELAFEERGTAERLVASLARLGLRDVARIGETGIVARVPGRNPRAPVVAVRGDIDALPIQEATGLPFASNTPGVMHAC